jgi:large subunit ribosomal protein L25
MKTAEKTVMTVTKRSEFGKKLRKLRHQNIIPANVFGKDFTSLAISIGAKEFYRVFKVARETGVIHLMAEGKEIPTMIKHVQRHPISSAVIHVDLRKIDLKQKIEAEVPVVVINESPAVKLGGVLLTQAMHLTVEALPTDIPSSIEVDASTITELGGEIKVQDLPKNSSYEIKNEPEHTIIMVVEHKEESLEPETTSEHPEITGETTDEATTESETSTEQKSE